MAIIPSPHQIEFSEKMQCIFSKKRYIVLYGGRGAGRSWGVARKLILKGRAQKRNILCARELQLSIDDSVHKTLKNQIVDDPPEGLGLRDEFIVQRDRIYGPGGTEFSFIGIKNDPNKVRSFEGIDDCWVEEANKVSRASWEVLTPTIRKKGSQIIITFNPELKEDYTYRRFVTDLLPFAKPMIYGSEEHEKFLAVAGEHTYDPKVQLADPASPLFGKILWYETEDTVICKMTYQDNPWFYESTALPPDMQKAKRDDEDEYLNVWMGFPRENLDGAIYAKELRRAQKENRICRVPYEREIPVDTFWDLGERDFTCIWFIQRVAMQWRVLDFLSASQQELSWFIKELKNREYAYGLHWLPHDAAHKRLGQPHTIANQLLHAFPRSVRVVPKGSVSDGINAVREVFPQCWFDESCCSEGIQGLRHYRHKVVNGIFSPKPDHDGSDPADAFRTFAMSRRLPRDDNTGEAVLAKLKPSLKTTFQGVAAGLGWLNQ